jgi:phospholipid/cholesterol/gamma-HCH transport system substrate-binding protein
MEPEARYTVVGTAVLILVALVVAAVLWLRSSGGGGTDRQYKIYFVNQSLEGLEVRSDVRMRGIRVGSVTGFTFSSRRRGAVEVFIRVDSSAPVRQSTEAVVERHLITGLASVRLVNPSELSPLLTMTPEDEPYPVIAEGESVYEQLSESVNQLAQRTDETMQRITATLSPENQAALSEVLKNLRSMTRDADKAVLAAAGAAGEVRGAAEEVRNLAASIAADARTLTARYDALGKQAGVSITDVAGEVKAMRQHVARLAERADRLMASGDVELRTTAQALRNAADALAAAGGRLRDPGQVLYGPPQGALGPGEARR